MPLSLQSIAAPSRKLERLHVVVQGAVQGVGFRPFVYKLATDLRLFGWVVNTPGGVVIEVEGPTENLQSFINRIEIEKPASAALLSLESAYLDPAGYSEFEIRDSVTSGASTATIMADLATCPDCLSEMTDRQNRRYRYPFINCTNCGPRYSIVLGLPYDRPNTTMRGFNMCARCKAEYDNPLNRRFHAQPIACPDCGPQIALWSSSGNELAVRDDALLLAAHELRQGGIVAIKGIGGFQILVDATSETAVRRLRTRKRREEKPFAVMFPNLAMAEKRCVIGEQERRLLCSTQSPIVIVERKREATLAMSVAPNNPDVGIMLPYSPLHHLLLEIFGKPLVATSGNLSDEPICVDEAEAVSQLGGIADFFLVHDRPIARHVDDSVVRVVAGRDSVIRRARGYAPLPISLVSPSEHVLAVGAHQKSTVALSVGPSAVVSQHIGDLDTLPTWTAFNRVIDDLSAMYQHQPIAVACDLHPDYRSTAYAHVSGRPLIPVQHHYAHILSCMADNQITGDVFGVSWDGTGYGTDGTIWGGEFLKVTGAGFTRYASLFPFRLPGGESAVNEPRRCGLGILYACFAGSAFDDVDGNIVKSFSAQEIANLSPMLQRGINSPITSSMGRLFDGIAAVLGLRQIVRHEGQAAMELEFRARDSSDDGIYRIPIVMHDGMLRADWRPMLLEIVGNLKNGVNLNDIARRFHNSLAELTVAAASSAGLHRVALSGGCFQNRLLTETTVQRLRAAGFSPYWHQRIPTNDGGISLGQLIGAARVLNGPQYYRSER